MEKNEIDYKSITEKEIDRKKTTSKRYRNKKKQLEQIKTEINRQKYKSNICLKHIFINNKLNKTK